MKRLGLDKMLMNEFSEVLLNRKKQWKKQTSQLQYIHPRRLVYLSFTFISSIFISSAPETAPVRNMALDGLNTINPLLSYEDLKTSSNYPLCCPPMCVRVIKYRDNNKSFFRAENRTKLLDRCFLRINKFNHRKKTKITGAEKSCFILKQLFRKTSTGKINKFNHRKKHGADGNCSGAEGKKIFRKTSTGKINKFNHRELMELLYFAPF